MRKKKTFWITLLLLFDFFSATLAWVLLYAFRKIFIETNPFVFVDMLSDSNLQLAIVGVPIGWLSLYLITGTYANIFQKSRLFAILRTLMQSLFGVTIIFFLLLLDDLVGSYKNYYATFGFLLVVHFSLTLIFRISLFTIIKHLLQSGKYVFNTAIIGGQKKASDFYNSNKDKSLFTGQNFVGYIQVNGHENIADENFLPHLGSIAQIEEILISQEVEYVIIALDSSEHSKLSEIINMLSGKPIVIKIIPDMYDILSGKVKMEEVVGEPLITIYPEPMAHWQQILKRVFDLVISSISLIVLFPLLLFIAVRVKLSSKGTVFYKQIRMGHQNQPFYIYKFRSMYTNAEQNGPALSSKNDDRITNWGKILRKWRLDELPQFWNVLKGDMSLVGPRPERAYYLDKMAESAPYVKHLQRVKPGVTSLGMVKYGYAENVEEMVERLKFDIIYIENQSLLLDFKILIYTIETLVKGRGK